MMFYVYSGEPATTKAPEYIYHDYDPKALEKKGQRYLCPHFPLSSSIQYAADITFDFFSHKITDIGCINIVGIQKTNFHMSVLWSKELW
jgi:hypothetical protein